MTVQAAIPPVFGQAIVTAHAVSPGEAGNIQPHAIDTKCCGSEFVTATNVQAFTSGRNARDYAYIQSSDIKNASSDLLASLTPQATAALQKEAHPGEQLVTPLCNPHTTSSAETGSELLTVTVSVTQTCKALAYSLDSLNQVATSTLARSSNLANYEQVGTVQVTVNGSTYSQQTARLQVALSGVWVYSFSQKELTHLKHLLTGVGKEKAQALLQQEPGIAQVSIKVQRLDFKDSLPTNPEHITMQFFYIVS